MIWLLVCLFVVALVFLNRWIRSDESFEKIPGPPGIYILENTFEFASNPVKLFYYLRKWSSTYKKFWKVKLGPRKTVFICNPQDTETVISSTKYNSKGLLYQFLEPWLKEGLLLSGGPKWYNRRKILTPAFHFNILRHFNLIFEENSRKMVEQLNKEVGKEKTDVTPFIAEFALHSICETAMGTQLDKEAKGIGRVYKDAILKMGVYVVYRATRFWLYSNIIFRYTTIGRKQRKILNVMSSFRDSVINKRRNCNEFKNLAFEDISSENDILISNKKLAMLDLLLQAETDGVIDAKGISEEVETFMFEGHDTTSTCLQFTLMLLANNPEAQEKIVEECNEIFGSATQQASLADLSRMKYLECCIKESLRLYPPVHLFVRNLEEPLILSSGDKVSAGADCVILTWDLHRRCDQFVDALKFKPERFLEEPTWHPYAYIPFSAGPRNCIGQKFAMNEMKLALSAVLREYKLLPVTTPQDLVFVADFILRLTHPIYVKFEKRT